MLRRVRVVLSTPVQPKEATKPMRTEAAAAGFYKSPWGNHPRLQILTIAELLDGKRIDYPPTLNVTHKRAPRHLPEAAEQHELPLAHDPDDPPALHQPELTPDELKDLAHKRLLRSLGKKPARPKKK